jgi:hypothetical protein
MPVQTEDEEFSFPFSFFNEKSVLIHLLFFKKKKKKFFLFFRPFLCVLESCAIGPRLKKSLFYYSFLGLYPSARNSKKKGKKFVFFFSFVVVVFLSANGSVIRAGAEENDRDVGVSTSRRPNVCVTRPAYTFTLFSFSFFSIHLHISNYQLQQQQLFF